MKYRFSGGEDTDSGGIPILEDSMRFVDSAINDKEAEWAESMRLTREDVAAAYHVNPSIVWSNDGQTYASARERPVPVRGHARAAAQARAGRHQVQAGAHHDRGRPEKLRRVRHHGEAGGELRGAGVGALHEHRGAVDDAQRGEGEAEPAGHRGRRRAHRAHERHRGGSPPRRTRTRLRRTRRGPWPRPSPARLGDGTGLGHPG